MKWNVFFVCPPAATVYRSNNGTSMPDGLRQCSLSAILCNAQMRRDFQVHIHSFSHVMSVTAPMDEVNIKLVYIPLKRCWYDLICENKKTIEYRAASNFWRSRFATGTHCIFQCGFFGTVCDHSNL